MSPILPQRARVTKLPSPDCGCSTPRKVQRNETKHGTSGLQAQSFLSFHPPLKRRLKRLERMGAGYSPEAHGKTSKTAIIVMVVLWLIVGLLLLAAAAMMLVVIAM